jgi:hypothetical protein
MRVFEIEQAKPAHAQHQEEMVEAKMFRLAENLRIEIGNARHGPGCFRRANVGLEEFV